MLFKRRLRKTMNGSLIPTASAIERDSLEHTSTRSVVMILGTRRMRGATPLFRAITIGSGARQSTMPRCTIFSRPDPGTPGESIRFVVRRCSLRFEWNRVRPKALSNHRVCLARSRMAGCRMQINSSRDGQTSPVGMSTSTVSPRSKGQERGQSNDERRGRNSDTPMHPTYS